MVNEVQKISNIVSEALKEIKATDIRIIDVEHITPMMCYIVICTATSTAHANALSKKLQSTIKNNKINLFSIEGQSNSGWIIVDLGDLVVHIMLKEIRELYHLEKIWTVIKVNK